VRLGGGCIGVYKVDVWGIYRARSAAIDFYKVLWQVYIEPFFVRKKNSNEIIVFHLSHYR
jgi:hypothetical protein